MVHARVDVATITDREDPMLLLIAGSTAFAADPPPMPAPTGAAVTSASDPSPEPAPGDPDPAPPTAPPTAEARLAALEAELAALRAEVDQERQDAILREAEALAASAPPPPPPPPTSASAFNPGITAFGDVLATVGARGGEVLPGSGPWIRSLELDLRASVDPFANAVAVLAVEQEGPDFAPPDPLGTPATDADAEPPEFGVAAEELYLDFVSFPAGFSLRAGGFRQPFGITNRAHPHDYPWPDVPLPLVALLGDEGLNEVGAVLSWHVPNQTGTGISLDAGINAGKRFDELQESPAPAWIGRAELFRRVGNVDLELGGSAAGLADLGATDDPGPVVGGDAMVRWHANSWRSVVLVAELLSDLGTDTTGGYASLQVQPTRPLYLSVRGDWLADPALADPTWLLGGYATFYTSEFLRLRAGASTTVSSDADPLVTGNLQLTFVWGSHPVEPYWVNR